MSIGVCVPMFSHFKPPNSAYMPPSPHCISTARDTAIVNSGHLIMNSLFALLYMSLSFMFVTKIMEIREMRLTSTVKCK